MYYDKLSIRTERKKKAVSFIKSKTVFKKGRESSFSP